MATKYFIKLSRDFDKWGWFDEPNTLKLWLYILLHANIEDKVWKGHLVKRGQLIIGRKNLSKTLKISEQSLRTSLSHLKLTNEITIESTNKYTLITVVKYNIYQDNPNKATNKSTNKSTSNQPATNQQLTTTKEYKNKELKNKRIYGTYKHVTLTDEELSKLVRDYGDLETQEAINYLDEYIEMKGTKYKSCYLAMKKWVFSAVKQKQGKKEYRDVLPEYYTKDNTNTKSNVDVDKEKLKEMLKSIGEHNG